MNEVILLKSLKFITKVGLCLCFFMLTSCQNKPIGYQVQSSKEVESWFLQGKVFVISPEERFSASIIWDKQEHISHIKLLSPLGATLLTLDITPTLSTLHVEGKTYYASDAEKLLWQTTSWLIPLKRMQQWVKGQPTPYDQVIKRNIQGQLSHLRTKYAAKVWHVYFKSWQTLFGAHIPERITAEHEQIKLKINIYDWIPQ